MVKIMLKHSLSGGKSRNQRQRDNISQKSTGYSPNFTEINKKRPEISEKTRAQIPIVPAPGGPEVAFRFLHKTFFIDRICMHRAPLRPERACFVRKRRTVPKVTLEVPNFTLCTSTSHPHFISSHLVSAHLTSSQLISSHLFSHVI